MERGNEQLATLVDALLASSKYKNVSKELITHIGAQELGKRRNVKEAIKATKNKLHQIGGAYLDIRVQYESWLNELRMAALTSNRDNLLHICTRIMNQHASTRERLPILEHFYSEIFTCLPPIRSVLDVACGLHPLAIPWMSLPQDTEYYACDIYQDMMDFLHTWMGIINIQVHTEVRDVIQQCPTYKVDLAFVLKAIPCLEQVDKSAGSRLLHTINADHLVVSFPISSLGGKRKGMVEHYEAHFRDLVANDTWEIKKLEFSSELVFVVTK
jgi:16S rRNA (guanine(1405)-N(7))-methyltransferase